MFAKGRQASKSQLLKSTPFYAYAENVFSFQLRWITSKGDRSRLSDLEFFSRLGFEDSINQHSWIVMRQDLEKMGQELKARAQGSYLGRRKQTTLGKGFTVLCQGRKRYPAADTDWHLVNRQPRH
ncbi:DNA ligase 1 [Striga asiatica]|uniref:DNA ligase 1 n=1 Tax=Striga asiatica TaxID=4170 RepID=A0A5A7PZ22_STRAF|nr:DNA ligase 1 [Striga asiatica]